MIEKDFLELMPDTVTIYNHTGTMNQWGSSTDSYAAGVTYNCTVRSHGDVIRTKIDEQQVVERGVIYIWGTPTVTTFDKVVLSDGQIVRVLYIETKWDESAIYMVVIHFGEVLRK